MTRANDQASDPYLIPLYLTPSDRRPLAKLLQGQSGLHWVIPLVAVEKPTREPTSRDGLPAALPEPMATSGMQPPPAPEQKDYPLSCASAVACYGNQLFLLCIKIPCSVL